MYEKKENCGSTLFGRSMEVHDSEKVSSEKEKSALIIIIIIISFQLYLLVISL
tara:strand:- start:29 stop:187 length:159 start_codon:yes stop_codon:yes gene_type:complete